jgi:phosphoribosyl-ATP pyrophosphohydrolase
MLLLLKVKGLSLSQVISELESRHTGQRGRTLVG